jgi:hypothetical protein
VSLDESFTETLASGELLVPTVGFDMGTGERIILLIRSLEDISVLEPLVFVYVERCLPRL